MNRLSVLLLSASLVASAAGIDQNIESFEFVWKTIRDNHWDPTYNGVDWHAVHDELRPRIETADTRGKARAVLGEMIHRLGQTHFSIIPEELVHSAEDGAGALDGDIGLDFRLVGESILVSSVQVGSPAAAAGIRTGWELLAMADTETATFLRELPKWIPSPLLIHVAARGEALYAIRGKPGTEARLKLADHTGRRLEIPIPRTPLRGERVQLGHLPPVVVQAESRRLESDIGYLSFNLFMNPVYLMDLVEQAVTSCLDCRGFVIDLRGNGGGLGTSMGTGIAGWFLQEQRSLGTIYTQRDRLNVVVYPRPRVYCGSLAVLIDGCSVSAAELFALGLKEAGRARLFGAHTAGAALPSTFARLPNGDIFQFAVAGYRSTVGQPLEGVGVAPDVEVLLTREALLEGRDPALEAALAWIKTQK